MPRMQGWPRLLNQYIVDAQERYKQTGLVWGAFDCCTFVSDWVQIATGVDPMADYRGTYATRDAGFAKLAAVDGSLRAALGARVGSEVPIAFGARGDIALLGDGCGILFTSGARTAALFLGDGGFTMYRAEDCEVAFRVG